MPPRNFVLILVTAFISFACYLKADRTRYASQISEAMQVVNELYVDDVKPRQLFENAMNGMVEGLDPYSGYIGPEVFKQMEQSLDQEFGGVGIEVEKLTDDKPILVLSPIFDSPGYRAGLRAGDLILAINGEQTAGMKQKDAIAKMRGKPGSTVKLRLKHAGAKDEIEVTVERDVIMVDSLLGDARKTDGSWDYRLQENPRIGYLRLTTFGKHSADEIREALGEGKKCPFDAVIIDLRNNAGGLLDAAVETCDLFLDEGRIVSTRGRDGKDRSSFPATQSTIIPMDVPMVVLVNKYSASASEIVAACLQDHHRAIIIGERTYGKGTVQNLFELEGGRSALKLTTASYWRPSGTNIHRRKDAPETEEWGVKPSEGFQVILSDEELEKVMKARDDRDHRDRKALQSATEPPKSPAPSSTTEPANSESPAKTTAPANDSKQPAESDNKSPASSEAVSPQKTSETSKPGTTPESGPSAPVDDPQLRRAIQHLESLLKPSVNKA